ncbi:Polyketide cyclase/dehydrase [Penicillium verhagenii]|nr:Polyketide cyclase/dehydrase [Penicillium verhagenii]
MPFNESKIEIAAAPAKVREILLNFAAYPEWHTTWIKSIEIEEENKTSESLGTGDKVKVDIEGFKFVVEVVENTESHFSWQGPPVFTIAGSHKFHMEPTEDGAGTIFTQSETSKGLMSFLFSPSIFGKKMRADYDVFNRDLKARAEASP